MVDNDLLVNDRSSVQDMSHDDINMEAVVFNGKELTLKYVKDFPIPKIVNDTDVIVKVEYSGICGTDVHIIQATYG
ncbi:hypothetical protein MSG28_015436 [Choristoneura fumiferana]|uniref:Uncharacterized protein n=1 Tax=Choristoneura fumiferana TaxID=7141 RepID=A0ACC0KBG7_CHOFU|nr:hypothetical protein MSG28_015436 [Choristoneura fumiferana]